MVEHRLYMQGAPDSISGVSCYCFADEWGWKTILAWNLGELLPLTILTYTDRGLILYMAYIFALFFPVAQILLIFLPRDLPASCKGIKLFCSSLCCLGAPFVLALKGNQDANHPLLELCTGACQSVRSNAEIVVFLMRWPSTSGNSVGGMLGLYGCSGSWKLLKLYWEQAKTSCEFREVHRTWTFTAHC